MKQLFFIFLLFITSIVKSQSVETNSYTIISNKNIETDYEWQKVISALEKKHNATTLYYDVSPRELVPQLQKIKPRYVAIVEKPQNIGRDFVFDLNRLARKIDDDIYTDFLWGIITGYTVEAALKMVHNSTEPLVISSAVSTIKELESGKWFDTFAYVDDHTVGYCGEKKKGDTSVSREKITETIDNSQEGKPNLLKKFYEFYRDYDPDLIVTASHATENNLEMPGSLGNIKAQDGVLYADFPSGKENLIESGKRRVYLPIGNCLIANIDKTPESMAVAWMNSANVTGMIGYVVTTWHGRNGWGALKYWLTTSGRYSLAEATFLNQQDMLYQLNEWSPKIEEINYQFDKGHHENLKIFGETLGEKPTLDQFGFFHDRDVLAYYGDPAWNVRLQELPEENDFSVTQQTKGNKCIITITTKPNFDLKRMMGDDFKKEHVLDIPFSYFFPKRLNNPRLAKNQPWEAALDENFILVYNADFKPNSEYEIVLEINEQTEMYN